MIKASAVDLASLRRQWDRIRPFPGGKALFSRALGVVAPYTGTIQADVEEMRPGYARVRMKDRRKVRNHLSSIHAVALVNLAELTGNLALIAGMPANTRMIVTGLSIDYLKKARGGIVATCEAQVPAGVERKELQAEVRLKDTSGELVARATIKCLIGPTT